MPELPEVETIKEDLRGLVVGSTVEWVEVSQPALVEGPSVEEFAGRLRGARIAGARRRAKHLIVELIGGDSLVLQLKIGGQLLLVPPVAEPETAVMLVLGLDGGRRLFLRDETGFTRARLLDAGELEARLSSLGPEPLGEGFDAGHLKGVLGGRRVQIKPALLDQKVVAGIGNIYVDEILYDAKVHPRRKANTLSEGEWAALHRAVRENLRAGIEHRGTTFDLYRDVLGRKGHHQDHLRVFVRAGRPCPSGCGGRVVKEKVGGRATFYCPSCQREDGFGGEQGLELGVL
ncbi:bifunctional DNA-formamidopyrimidine glycosylase/DNA-(apurinic or apyrimidinic site) lyase [Rubrobacter marinus]|uniref:Bifunctional DNA-formamidopyrimidine glycosylase/DNA-(Apurinic or apyrimidinic site) lyase n=1 Tax=Rubrobacter marinus TaxID=2653852 RepID=A0A6G8Q158_9ACTN|nr:bifunctional DNA-formamidopyrimidine glycosylase/DNA-(apurinic or apyrimidinic site) lyase [Rubrobacter marinus]QIN80203.1 bifunctional DNA-formamidopyrimidine glycosylase/DNA-(apurinic or apyrimidinic site) lyase [Rubrobacter marinus]